MQLNMLALENRAIGTINSLKRNIEGHKYAHGKIYQFPTAGVV